MDFHRRQEKKPAKSTIKPFKQSISEVTGVFEPLPSFINPNEPSKHKNDSTSENKKELEPKIPTPDMFYQDPAKHAPSKT